MSAVKRARYAKKEKSRVARSYKKRSQGIIEQLVCDWCGDVIHGYGSVFDYECHNQIVCSKCYNLHEEGILDSDGEYICQNCGYNDDVRRNGEGRWLCWECMEDSQKSPEKPYIKGGVLF